MDYADLAGLLGEIQVVQPETILRRHRSGFKAFWCWKSRTRAGRPKLDRELTDSIRRMSRGHPLCGSASSPWQTADARIRGCSIYNLQMHATTSEAAIATWKTFLRNHADALGAIDICVVPTLTFNRLFAVLILNYDWRQLLSFEVIRQPTTEWLARQISEAFFWASAPTYLVRDNDRAYGHIFTSRVTVMGIRDRPISPGSP